MGKGRYIAIVVAAAVVSLAAAVAWSGQQHAGDTAADLSPADAWQLEWSDDFAGAAGALPSRDDWLFDLGTAYPGGPPNWGNGESQSYTDDPANVATDGAGNLRITPLRDAAGAWTSARLETTRADFKAPDGGVLRIESRIQMPDVTGDAALGYWPTFWAVGSPSRGKPDLWPSIGEIDISDQANGTDSVGGTLHCGVAPGGPCNELVGRSGHQPCPGTPCPGNFHTYRFEWDRSVTPNQLRWSVDGEQFHTVEQDDVDAATWSDMADHAGYFLLLDVAIGGAMPDGSAGVDTPTAATAPGKSMVVDYVAVWSGGAGVAGGADPRPPDDDPAIPSTTATTVVDPTNSTSATTVTTAAPTTTSPPTTTAPTVAGRNAYAATRAESFDAQTGIQLEATVDHGGAGGSHIGFIARGDQVRYDNVDFGARTPVNLEARVASGLHHGATGTVEVRVDTPTAAPIARFAIASTGGWQSWVTKATPVTAITGRHTVYLTFASDQHEDFVNISWFRFAR